MISDTVLWVICTLSVLSILFVGIWGAVTITRLKVQMAIATAIIETLSARAGLKELIDKIQSSVPTHRQNKEAH